MWDKAKIKPVPQGERGHFNPGAVNRIILNNYAENPRMAEIRMAEGQGFPISWPILWGICFLCDWGLPLFFPLPSTPLLPLLL
jgi:hypothetical protein